MAFPKRSGTDPKYQTREHRDYRARLLTQLRQDGYLICTAKVCALPTRHITEPNGRKRDGLHAGHNDEGTNYDGPQHNVCNVKDGARRARARQDQPATQLGSFTTLRTWG